MEIGTKDASSILEHFRDLEDPRSAINRKHLFGELIIICILAVIAGADGPKAIGVWAAAHADWLRAKLRLPAGLPSHDTLGRLLTLLKPAAFQKCFQSWISTLRGQTSGGDSTEREIVAIDGKALRRSHNKRLNLGALFVVSAWSTNRGISLGQLATAEKSNEITAIPELIDQIDIKNAIVTIDAAGCQTEIAGKIIDGEGDYVLALKGNQGKLHKAVMDFIDEQMENDFANVPVRTHREILKGHGRVDDIVYYQFSAPDTLPKRDCWKGLRTIGVAVRVSQQGDKETGDVRYYISSLPTSVRRFAKAVRGHWGIENTLHWCLDVTFREDESRLRDRNAADNLAWLRRFALTLLKQQNDKESIAMRRRMAGWDIDYLATILGI